jgi:hypothetical protein
MSGQADISGVFGMAIETTSSVRLVVFFRYTRDQVRFRYRREAQSVTLACWRPEVENDGATLGRRFRWASSDGTAAPVM